MFFHTELSKKVSLTKLPVKTKLKKIILSSFVVYKVGYKDCILIQGFWEKNMSKKFIEQS